MVCCNHINRKEQVCLDCGFVIPSETQILECAYVNNGGPSYNRAANNSLAAINYRKQLNLERLHGTLATIESEDLRCDVFDLVTSCVFRAKYSLEKKVRICSYCTVRTSSHRDYSLVLVDFNYRNIYFLRKAAFRNFNYQPSSADHLKRVCSLLVKCEPEKVDTSLDKILSTTDYSVKHFGSPHYFNVISKFLSDVSVQLSNVNLEEYIPKSYRYKYKLGLRRLVPGKSKASTSRHLNRVFKSICSTNRNKLVG